MTEAEITTYTINGALVGLTERKLTPTQEHQTMQATVLAVPGGGRVLVAPKDMLAAVTELLGPSARLTNPYERRRQKEFLRRARCRIISAQSRATPTA